jgi:hypothetical protein
MAVGLSIPLRGSIESSDTRESPRNQIRRCGSCKSAHEAQSCSPGLVARSTAGTSGTPGPSPPKSPKDLVRGGLGGFTLACCCWEECGCCAVNSPSVDVLLHGIRHERRWEETKGWPESGRGSPSSEDCMAQSVGKVAGCYIRRLVTRSFATQARTPALHENGHRAPPVVPLCAWINACTVVRLILIADPLQHIQIRCFLCKHRARSTMVHLFGSCMWAWTLDMPCHGPAHDDPSQSITILLVFLQDLTFINHAYNLLPCHRDYNTNTHCVIRSTDTDTVPIATCLVAPMPCHHHKEARGCRDVMTTKYTPARYLPSRYIMRHDEASCSQWLPVVATCLADCSELRSPGLVLQTYS